MLAGPGAVWGALYVTEGATLGGRVLRRHIQARLGPVPARFLDGRGDRTQPMWRDLGRLADLYVNSEHDRQLAQQTATQAFAAFSTWAGNHGETQRNDAEKRVDPIWAVESLLKQNGAIGRVRGAAFAPQTPAS